MVPDGVVRPSGSVGVFAVLSVLGAGSIWPNAGRPTEIRQARQRPRINTRLEENMIFSRDLSGSTPAMRNHRSREALIVSKRGRGSRIADRSTPALSALRPVNVRAGAVENFRRFHHRFRKR